MGSMGSGAGDWPHIPLEAVGGGDHPAAGEQGACTVVGPVLLDAHDPGPLGIGAVLTTHDPVKLLGLPTGWGCWRRRSHFITPGAQASRPVHARAVLPLAVPCPSLPSPQAGLPSVLLSLAGAALPWAPLLVRVSALPSSPARPPLLTPPPLGGAPLTR